jgi:hypothetical protein
MNSRELDLDNFTYNRKDRTNKNGGGWIVYFHDYVKYERRVELESAKALVSSLSKYGYHDTLLLGGLYIKHNKKDF